MDAALSIRSRGLTRVFGSKTAVDHVDLEVPRGVFYGFLGPNGAGKSTTIKMLTGLLAPTAGDIEILGLDFFRHPLEVKARIGVVPEDLCLFDNLRPREYLTFIGRMYRLDQATLDRRVDELLELFTLQEAEDTLALEFSHGMKKKLALAAALIHDPELLFLDEPFEGIDAIASRGIKRILQSLVDRGSTIFLTSHILEIVEKLCAHVGIIHEGRLISQAPLEKLPDGKSLEESFIEAVGDEETRAASLSWLAAK